MPRNGSGIYTVPTGTIAVTRTDISSSAYDTFLGDLSTEITNSLNVQGTAPMLATLNMGTFRIVNAGAPVAATDVAIMSYVDGSIPAGMIMGYALDVNPPAGASGWLACQGYSLSTTIYANLFAAIGYTYGGSGANFTIPDLRGCFLRGFDGGRGLDFQGSRSAGVFQASYMNNHFHAVVDPQHFHNISDPGHTHTATTGGHNHTVNDPTHVHGGVAVTGSGTFVLGSAGFQIQGGNTAAASTGISLNAVGNLGVTVNNAFTGVETFDAPTGVTVGSVSTGNVNFSATETTVQNYPILWCIKY